MVVGEVAAREDGVDQGQARRRPVAHRHRDGAVQLDHRRRLGAQRARRTGRRSAPSRSRRRWAPRRAPPRSPPGACTGRSGATRAPAPPARGPRRSARDPRASGPGRPAGPGRRSGEVRAARRDSCSSISASRPMASGSGSSSTSSRPSRMASPERSAACQRLARRGRVALVEDQVDHVQHRVQALRQLAEGRDLVRDAARRGSSPWRGRCAGPAWAAR